MCVFIYDHSVMPSSFISTFLLKDMLHTLLLKIVHIIIVDNAETSKYFFVHNCYFQLSSFVREDST